jgi:YidC/Oxa1 family membrane protein insertase
MERFFRFLLVFSLTWLLFSWLGFFNQAEEKNLQDDLVIKGEKEISLYTKPQFTVFNNTDKTVLISSCWGENLSLEKYQNGEFISLLENKDCQKDKIKIESKTKKNFQPNLTLKETSKYQFKINLSEKTYLYDFEVVPPGFFKRMWNTFIYQPIYNLLILIISILPNYSLAWGIIILTLLVRLILLAPNHKALKSQKHLQEIQPKLEEVKKKYKGNDAKIAEETMKIWKKEKVNPLGSCLPILLQFPILIAVFLVLRNGVANQSELLIYDMFKDFDFAKVSMEFFTLNLRENGTWYLGILIAGFQFLQMKLSFNKNLPKKENSKENDFMALQMKMMNNMFTYFMPLLIGFFTLSVPAGVGLYWGVSTAFGVIQQYLLQRKSKV